MHVGGHAKYKSMVSPKPPFYLKSNLNTLESLLEGVAKLCSTHYAAFDFRKLVKLYGDPSPGGTIPSECLPRDNARSPGPLDDHADLRTLFRKYSSDDDPTHVSWPREDPAKEQEDLFVKHRV